MQPAQFDILSRPSRTGAIDLLESTGLPSSDLTDEMIEHFFFVGPPSAPRGLVGVEMFGEHALLRSLVVASSERSNGVGSALLDHAESYARSKSVRRLFLLTTTAEAFFARHGFVPMAREVVPHSIRSTREFAEICPASSILMVKSL